MVVSFDILLRPIHNQTLDLSRLLTLQDDLLSEKVHTRDFAMEKQTRAQQICDDDRKRFRRLHDEEWEGKRVKRLYSRLSLKICSEK